MHQNISKLHLDILDNKRLDVLKKLTPYISNFVLAGGTALALQINHRKSYDFDFFSSEEISPNFALKLRNILVIQSIAVDTSDELTLYTSDTAKISFIYYPFSEYFKTGNEDKLTYYLSESIAIQKAYTIGRRGAYRDYFDLYSLLNKKVIIFEDIIEKAEKAYGSLFNAKLFLEQLTYFGDITNFEIIPVNQNEGNIEPDEVKKFLEETVKKFINTNKF